MPSANSVVVSGDMYWSATQPGERMQQYMLCTHTGTAPTCCRPECYYAVLQYLQSAANPTAARPMPAMATLLCALVVALLAGEMRVSSQGECSGVTLHTAVCLCAVSSAGCHPCEPRSTQGDFGLELRGCKGIFRQAKMLFIY